MPCYRNPGIEITRGTITKTRLSADVVIGYPDPIPAGRLSHLYVKTDWHGEPGERNVVLRFRSQTAQSGQILFDGEGAAGSETRTISGNMEILVAIYGQRASVGEAPDVMLDVVIDDEPRGESLPLSVRQPEAVPADAHQILRRELGIALRASRPAAAPEQAIWDRYNGIFEDARAFADPLATQSIGSASVPLVDDRLSDQSFNLQEIRDHLSSSRNPESLANAKAIGKNNAFDLFQGHWRGSWRQNNACGTSMNECEDHEWQEVQRLEPNSKIYVQNGVTGHDSHLYIAPTEDAQPPTCLSLNTPRDVGINVAKAIDTERGTIVGARDVNPRPDEGGVQARCPCVGFYINQGKLLWVVQEALEGDMAVYSVLMETSPGAEVDPVDDQRVATVGFHFKWNRATRQIANAPETKAGQLRKLLTDAERQLEEQFRNRRLQSGHLQDMRYRRRLESFSSTEAQRFLEHTEEADLRDYLERLVAFLGQQEALRESRARGAPEERENITFIMGLEPPGADNPFYTSATAHFTINPRGETHTDLRTLQEVRDYLEAHAPSNGHPWGEVNIIIHGNEEGGMSIPVRALQPGEDPGTHQVSLNTLGDAVSSGNFAPLSNEVMDALSTLRIRGCAIGRSDPMLDLLSRAFGGQDLQRPTVIAPRHLQGYSHAPRNWHPTQGTSPETSDEYYAEFWYVGFPQGDNPSNDALLAMFQAEHAGVGLDWRDALSRSGQPSGDRPARETRTRTYTLGNPPFTREYYPLPANDQVLENLIHQIGGDFSGLHNVHETSRTANPDGSFRIEFNYVDQDGNDGEGAHIDARPAPPSTQAELEAFLAGYAPVVSDLALIDHTVNDYTWTFNAQDASIGHGARRWTMSAVGRRTIVRVARELREPDPDHPGSSRRMHPEPTEAAHFGLEVPAVPSRAELGENVTP